MCVSLWPDRVIDWLKNSVENAIPQHRPGYSEPSSRRTTPCSEKGTAAESHLLAHRLFSTPQGLSFIWGGNGGVSASGPVCVSCACASTSTHCSDCVQVSVLAVLVLARPLIVVTVFRCL